jgi:hypothetical protein
MSGARRRVPGRPFQPGQSGNPSGRPKSHKEFLELLDAKVIPQAVDKLRESVEEGKEWAATLALAYRYGKPTQVIAGDVEREPVTYIVDWAAGRKEAESGDDVGT